MAIRRNYGDDGIKTNDNTRPAPLEGIVRLPEWFDDALCPEVGTDLFFPKKGGSHEPARAICNLCPVREECLEYAIAYESGAMGTATSYAFIGIYGGKTPNQRKAIIRARRQENAA